MIIWFLMITTPADIQERWIYSTHEVLSECFEAKRTQWLPFEWKPGTEVHCVAAGEV